jgi:farnesyl diphosphate synthase
MTHAAPSSRAAETPATDFLARLSEAAADVEAEIARILTDGVLYGEIARPERLVAAMRHATLNGGKRLRPYLVIASAEALDRDRATASRAGLVRAATALELVHCYSLVHDDLPSMDDDDLRRGQPTVHKAFDEATAILAGDALLTLAFDLMADPATSSDPLIRLELVSGLARASGLGGMVGGQVLDLAAEGRYAADGLPLRLGEADIRELQAMKTGALLRFACEAGAIFVGSPATTRQAMATFGRLIGQAFQIADDLIDLESAPATAGKATGKDAAKGKATLVGLHGAEAARAELDRLVAAADACLVDTGADDAELRAASRFIATRAF